MKNFMIAAGWTLLYLLIYLMANIIASVGLMISYFIALLLQRTELSPIDYIFEHIMIVLLIASVLSIVLYYLIFLVRGVNLNWYAKFKSMSPWQVAVSALIGAGIAMFLNAFMTMIEIDRLFPTDTSEMDMLLSGQNVFLLLLTVGIVVPIFEELLFRGLIFNALKWSMPLWGALVLQGLIFGAIHGNLLQFTYTFPLGIYLGLIYVQFGSLWAPILVHLFWNSTSVLMSSLLPAPDSIKDLLIYAILGLALMSTGVVIYYTRAKNPHAEKSG